MILFVVLLLILALWKLKPVLKGFHSDYASVEQSRSINGVCIMLILLSHTFARVQPVGVLDEIYEPLRVFLGQFVVVPFLFYSGYGIMESIKRNDNYIKTFPRKRLLRIALQFAVITVLYVILHLILRTGYSPLYILLSFFGITSIGNGGWYMLSLFVFYIAVIIGFNVFRKSKTLAALFVSVCLVALTVVEILFEFPSYYYSITVFFAVEMFYSLLKEHFDRIVMKNNVIWSLFFVVGLLGFILLKSLMDKSVLFYPIWCGAGMLMLLCLTMKVKIQNCALIWLGKVTFFIFTLQGIPQILFTRLLTNNYLIYVLVVVTALLLAALAAYLFKKIDKLLLKIRKT